MMRDKRWGFERSQSFSPQILVASLWFLPITFSAPAEDLVPPQLADSIGGKQERLFPPSQ